MFKKYLFFAFCSFLFTHVNAQKLGFSEFGIFSSSNNSSNENIYFNSGEPIVNTSDELVRLNNGILNQIKFNSPDFNIIQIQFFYDENQNGVKEFEEPYLDFGAVTSDFQNYINASQEGILLVAQNGDYSFEFNSFNTNNWNLSTSAEVTVTIDENNKFANIEYGLIPDVIFTDAEVFMTSGNFRCCNERSYTIGIKNTGTTIIKDTLWIKMDERISNVRFFEEPDLVIDSNYVGYVLDLFMQHTAKFRLTLKVPCIQDGFFVGDYFKQVAWIKSDELFKEFCFDQELRCAYDPNDKLVHPNREDSLALFGQTLTYTLRFQNTGNDYAEDVVVTDTLDTNLDLSTFKVLDTSHPDHLVVESVADDPYVFNFRFDDIILPDSTSNPIGSNGHVTFSIKPFDGLAYGTTINNTGHIYFDFNPPIVTNTTGTTYVDAFPVVSAKETLHDLNIEIFPNPTKGHIQLSETVDRIKVLDLTGRQLLEEFNQHAFSLEEFISGIYIVELTKDGRSRTEKITLSK